MINQVKKTWYKGESLKRRQFFASENKKFFILMDNDGDLLLCHTKRNRVLWRRNTGGSGNRLVMEANGNLAIYDNRGNIIAESGTGGRGEYMQLEDDANMVIYNSNQVAIWSTGVFLS